MRKPPTADEYRRGMARVAYCLDEYFGKLGMVMTPHDLMKIAVACIDNYENELQRNNGVPHDPHP